MTLAHDQAQTSTARLASGSSFYTAMRVLPRAKRDAVMAIYAFCRAVDDIADDSTTDRASRMAALSGWRDDVDTLYSDHPLERLQWLYEPIRDWGLARDDFHAVIDGMMMDVTQDIVAPNSETLDLYCDRVASAVGRLTVRVFGVPLDLGHQLAHHLGRALQLTNILRDIDEDAGIGRVYLPDVALARAGIERGTALERLPCADLTLACEPVAAMAHRHFDEAWRIMKARPKEEVRAPALMAEVYGALLERLERRGFAAPRERVRLPKARLLFALLRNGLM